MAKGKRAAALFEVIQASKEKEQLRAKGGGFLTPSWWFKGQSRANGNSKANGAAATPPAPRAEEPSRKVLPATPAPIVQEAPEPEAAPLSIAAKPAPEVDDESDIPEGQTEESLSATFTPEPPRPPVHRDFVDNEEPAMDDPKPAPQIKPAPPTAQEKLNRSLGGVRKPVRVAVDHGRQQIVLRLSFTSAAITTFAVVVVVALIVLVTKSMTHSPSAADASSIDSVKNGKANPGVLTVFQGKGNDEPPISAMPAPKPLPQTKTTPPTAPKSAVAKAPDAPKETAQTAAKPAQETGLNAAGKRIVGLQYVLMQAYPDPEDANDAAKALKAAGIDATVEKVPWFNTRWPCVVGMRGFSRTKNNPEYEAYIKAIQDVSNQFAGPSKFRRFEPQVIGWKE